MLGCLLIALNRTFARALPADQDHHADGDNNLVMTYRVQGRFAEAEEFLRRELETHRSARRLLRRLRSPL